MWNTIICFRILKKMIILDHSFFLEPRTRSDTREINEENAIYSNMCGCNKVDLIFQPLPPSVSMPIPNYSCCRAQQRLFAPIHIYTLFSGCREGSYHDSIDFSSHSLWYFFTHCVRPQVYKCTIHICPGLCCFHLQYQTDLKCEWFCLDASGAGQVASVWTENRANDQLEAITEICQTHSTDFERDFKQETKDLSDWWYYQSPPYWCQYGGLWSLSTVICSVRFQGLVPMGL